MPAPEDRGAFIACPSCDQLYQLDRLQDGDQAQCTCCQQVLTVYRDHAFVQAAAFSATGLICLLLACSFPFMSFQSMGLESVMTIPQAITQIFDEGMWFLALLVAVFILITPAIVLLLTGALAVSLAAGWRNHWAGDFAKFIFHLQTWSMAEVFFIGVLVSYVKIAHMATVTVGTAFWAYAAFGVFFTLALSRLDAHQTWRRLEELEP